MLTVVADAANFSSMRLTPTEKASMAATWTRILIEIVPEDRLLDALDRAMVDHKSSFMVNGYDLKLAYERIIDEETEARRQMRREADEENRKSNPVKFCPERFRHLSESGDVSIVNVCNISQDVVAPCRACRPKAYEAWYERHIEKHGGAVAAELSPYVEKPALTLVKSDAEIIPSAAEIASLLSEYNSLIAELVPETAAHEKLRLIWDEGALCFKHPHTASVTFSPKSLARKIEDYKNIIARADGEKI